LAAFLFLQTALCHAFARLAVSERAIALLFEGLFGGVTLDLMHQQSRPVLMSH
jgi:hypothetical protein